MKQPVRLLLFGLMTWIVPFVVAFGFYDQQGQLTTSYGLFKCTMVVVSGLTGCYALYKYLGWIESSFAKQGWIVGLVWLGMNLLLDLVVLIPLSGMALDQYVTTIALGYLLIPIICVTGGMIAERGSSKMFAKS